MGTGILAGAAAGAAGTTALDVVTYLDMAVRGRPASDTPQRTVEALVSRSPVRIPGEGETRRNRVHGIGALSGLVTGVALGGVFGVLRGLGLRPGPIGGTVVIGLSAMVATNASMIRLRVTDPRAWSAADWLSDLLPHLAYGAVTAATLRALDRPR